MTGFDRSFRSLIMGTAILWGSTFAISALVEHRFDAMALLMFVGTLVVDTVWGVGREP